MGLQAVGARRPFPAVEMCRVDDRTREIFYYLKTITLSLYFREDSR